MMDWVICNLSGDSGSKGSDRGWKAKKRSGSQDEEQDDGSREIILNYGSM